MSIRQTIERTTKRLISRWRQFFNRSSRAKKADSNLAVAQVKKTRSTSKLPNRAQIKHFPLLLSKNERLIASVAILIVSISGFFLVRGLINTQRVTVPAVGGEYTEGVVGAPQLVNPLYANISDVDSDLSRLIYSSLMKYDPQEGLVPDLAESYEISEDGTQYTFVLNENARWHDGQRVMADDILFTYSAIKNRDYRSPLEPRFSDVTIEQIDERTVRFTLEDPFAPFLSYLTVGILPSHFWQEISPVNATLTELNIKPIGSGPFKFEKLVKDAKGTIISYELVRFDNYYDQAPYLETVTFKFYPSNTAAVDALRNHNVQGVAYLPPSEAESIQQNINGTLITPKMTQYTAAFLNTDSDILSSRSVREALAYGTNKPALIESALSGYGTEIHTFVVDGILGHDPNVPTRVYDPPAAIERLENAGWNLPADLVQDEETTSETSENTDEEIETPPQGPAEQDGIRVKNGSPLTLSLVTIDSAELVAVAQILQEQWREIGIDVEIQRVNSNTLQNEVLANRSYDILLSGELYQIDPDLYAFWHSSQADASGLNVSGYENSSVDTWIVEARTTTDPETREELYQSIQNTVIEDAPAVFLYQPHYTYYIADDLQGVDLETIVSPTDRLTNMNHWYIKTKKVLR